LGPNLLYFNHELSQRRLGQKLVNSQKFPLLMVRSRNLVKVETLYRLVNFMFNGAQHTLHSLTSSSGNSYEKGALTIA
jgi:hypothetical protein